MSSTPIVAATGATRAHRRRLLRPAHLFVLPYLVFLLAFGVGPGIYALLISFAKFRAGRPQFFQGGLSNYTLAFSDFRFLPAFANVLRFLAVSVPVGVVGVVALALLLHARPGRLSSTLRTIYFIPGAVTGPALILLAIFMFDPTTSPFRAAMQALGYQAAGDVVRLDNLPLIFTIIGFFAGAGGWIAIFYGALNSISHEVIEAAIIDGCSPWQLALYIKQPLIRPYIAYMLILIFAGNVQLFAEPQLIGAAGAVPISKYWSPNQLGYAFAFEVGNFGASAAVSLVMLLIGLVGAYLVIATTDLYRTDATN